MTTIRTGRKLGRTLYQQAGPEPSDSDTLIGLMDTAALASEVAEAVSMARAGRGAGVSVHAATIREALRQLEGNGPVSGDLADAALAALDALEAERDQLIGQITEGRAAEGELRAESLELTAVLARKDEALRRIIDNAEAWHGVAQKSDGHAKALAVIATWARAALGQA